MNLIKNIFSISDNDNYKIIEFYGQNVYVFDKNGYNTGKLVDDFENEFQKNTEGQFLCWLLKK